MRRALTVVALGATLLPAPAFADVKTQTDVGLFAAVVAGTHVGSDNPVPVNGIVPGAALEVTQHVERFRLHLEGIPTVSANGTNSGPFGHSTASLSLLNTTIMADIDPHARFRLGAGYQFVNLTNTNGSNGDRNAVRIASPIYAAGATLPLPSDHFVELNFMVDPNLRGTLLIYNDLGEARPNKPEQGAEVDYSGAYGWRRRNIEYLFGFRGLSYHTRNTMSGELVDRNVGGGVTAEARFLLGK
jgi:hypothetical protein